MIAGKDLEIARELKQRLSEIVSLVDFKSTVRVQEAVQTNYR